MKAHRKMHLVAYLRTGAASTYPSGWRHPASRLNDLFAPDRYEHIARVLEAARFDAGFFADGFGIPDLYRGHFADFIGRGGQISLLDPMIVLPFMARVTSRIGLGATISTSFTPPYQIARSMASFDWMSGGRAAWNVVTSARNFEARNFGLNELAEKESRYDMAEEVMEACDVLWSSWDDGALLLDRNSGRFADSTKIHYVDYDGRYIRTRGPLTTPRSPQVRPVILQAGSSARGRDFAARWAEVIFSTPATKEDSIIYVADLRQRIAAIGRSPDECAILPSLSIVVAETESIAREKAEFIESLVDRELVLATSSFMIDRDLSDPNSLADNKASQGVQGHKDRLVQTARSQGITLEEAARKPRRMLVGTPAAVADVMEDWFRNDACDGFILPATVDPSTFEEIGSMLVPELQRRGLFRSEYAGKTLRENLRNSG